MPIDVSCPEHQRFLQLTQDFYRLSDCPLEHFESAPDEPIAFDAQVGPVKFSIGYDPAAGPARLFVYCVLGEVPADNQAPVLRRLLELNLAQAREHGGTYCLDGETQEVVYYLRASAAGMDAAGLHEELARVARIASRWREDRFLGEQDDGDGDAPMPTPGQANPWLLFA
jgi:hypothetical protein